MNQLTPIEPAGLTGSGVALSSADFQAIAAILHQEARISLAPHKATLVRSRGLDNFGDYVRLIRRDREELRTMVDALTTNHTHFFREKHHFDHLGAHMIPQWRAGADTHALALAVDAARGQRFHDAEIARRMVRELKPDMMLLDMQMPDMAGLEFLKAVRADPVIGKTVFIMLTGSSERTVVQKAAELGVNNYVVKPFAPAALKEKIERVFGELT